MTALRPSIDRARGLRRLALDGDPQLLVEDVTNANGRRAPREGTA